MKSRPYNPPKREADADFRALAAALAALDDPRQVAAFLRDLCTPAELEALCDRWKVVPLLVADEPYRGIHDRTGVSVTTIGRVARTLEQGAGGYAAALAAVSSH
ncbi:MAG TPA: YerC/YecD family TrpR-related protein [Thermomonas sp.]|jgi:TrpR-related protein YerC/YecD|nr:YerC/YecD family TrpR-related protein [Thermomonas sp.]